MRGIHVSLLIPARIGTVFTPSVMAIMMMMMTFLTGLSTGRPATRPMIDSTKLIPLSVNAEPMEESPTIGAVQSDMMLTSDQLTGLFQEAESQDTLGDSGPADRPRRRRRKAVGDATRLWPQGIIPYEISSSSSLDRSIIEAAISEWEQHTCLDFQRYTRRLARQLRHTNRVVFFKGSGCWSNVGRSYHGAQSISIGEGCAILGTVMHEIGHAIGFYHEHSRPDRADYIRVHSENIDPRYHLDFRQLSWGRVASMNVPYDTKSIMHYGSYYQSVNGEATITTIDPLSRVNLGQRDGLSFSDVKLANIIYHCNAHCGPTPADVECLNGGFIGPSCSCVCPDDYSGPNCSEFTPRKPKCAEILTEDRGEVFSPNYPAAYENNIKCIWHIQGSDNTTIEITINYFSMEDGDNCPFDHFRYLQSDMSPLGQRYCGSSPPSSTTVFPMNEVIIEFQSDATITSKGFHFTYEILPYHRNDV